MRLIILAWVALSLGGCAGYAVLTNSATLN